MMRSFLPNHPKVRVFVYLALGVLFGTAVDAFQGVGPAWGPAVVVMASAGVALVFAHWFEVDGYHTGGYVKRKGHFSAKDVPPRPSKQGTTGRPSKQGTTGRPSKQGTTGRPSALRPCPIPPARLNPPSQLPPVDCPLVIEVNGQLLRAERTSFVQSRDQALTYRLRDGVEITGRFCWTYP